MEKAVSEKEERQENDEDVRMKEVAEEQGCDGIAKNEMDLKKESEGVAVMKDMTEDISLNGEDSKEISGEISESVNEQRLKRTTRKLSTSSNKSTRSDNGSKNGDTPKSSSTKDKSMVSEDKKVPVPTTQTVPHSSNSTPTPSVSSTRSTRSQNPEFLARQRSFLQKVHLASSHPIEDDLLTDDDESSTKSTIKSSGSVGNDEMSFVSDIIPSRRKRERSASNGTVSPRVPSPSFGNMQGSSVSGNNSGSSSPAVSQMQPATKKRRSTRSDSAGMQLSPTPSTDTITDRFCWLCHKDGVVISCETCPRVYHLRCVQLENAPTDDWVCPECMTILHAENVDTRSRAMQLLTLDQLCNLLKYAVSRMKSYSGAEPFWKAVDKNEFPLYREYVAHPMDLSLLERNIKKKLYGSTEAFIADTKWLLHNCIIFNSYQSRLTNIAKVLVKICRQEMAEIENCPDCYLNAHTRKDSWFIEVCRRPHILVWAKLKGFPFWPAKVMRINKEGMVDVRFFGAHDRAWVPVRECFLYSKQMPASARNKKRNNLEACIEEVELHAKKLKDKYGAFNHAPFRTHFDPTNQREQLRQLLPTYNPDDDPVNTRRTRQPSIYTYRRPSHGERDSTQAEKDLVQDRKADGEESLDGYLSSDMRSKGEKRKLTDSENEDDIGKRASRPRARSVSRSRASRSSSGSVSEGENSVESDVISAIEKKDIVAKSASLIEWSKFEETAAQLVLPVVSDEDKQSVASDDRRDIVGPIEEESEEKSQSAAHPHAECPFEGLKRGLSIVDKLHEKLKRLEKCTDSDEAILTDNGEEEYSVPDDKKTDGASTNSEDCEKNIKIGANKKEDINWVVRGDADCSACSDRDGSESPVLNKTSTTKCYIKRLSPRVVLYDVALSKSKSSQPGSPSTEVPETEKEEISLNPASEVALRLQSLLDKGDNNHETSHCSESSSSEDAEGDIINPVTDMGKCNASEDTSDSGEGTEEVDALKRTPEHGYSKIEEDLILEMNQQLKEQDETTGNKSEVQSEKPAEGDTLCISSTVSKVSQGIVAHDLGKESLLEESKKDYQEEGPRNSDRVSPLLTEDITGNKLSIPTLESEEEMQGKQDESVASEEKELPSKSNTDKEDKNKTRGEKDENSSFTIKGKEEPSKFMQEKEREKQNDFLICTEKEETENLDKAPDINSDSPQTSDMTPLLSEKEKEAEKPAKVSVVPGEEWEMEEGEEQDQEDEGEDVANMEVFQSSCEAEDKMKLGKETEECNIANPEDMEVTADESPPDKVKHQPLPSPVSTESGNRKLLNPIPKSLVSEEVPMKEGFSLKPEGLQQKNINLVEKEKLRSINLIPVVTDEVKRLESVESVKDKNVTGNENTVAENRNSQEGSKCNSGGKAETESNKNSDNDTEISKINDESNTFLTDKNGCGADKSYEENNNSGSELEASKSNTAAKVYPTKPSKSLEKKIQELNDLSRTEFQLGGNGVTITPTMSKSVPKEKAKVTDNVTGKEAENTTTPRIKEEPVDPDEVLIDSAVSSLSSAQNSAKSSPDGKHSAVVSAKKSESELNREKEAINKKLAMLEDKERLASNDSPASVSDKDGIFPSLFLDPSITITVINDKQGDLLDVPATSKTKAGTGEINVNELRASVNLSKDISLTVVSQSSSQEGDGEINSSSSSIEGQKQKKHKIANDKTKVKKTFSGKPTMPGIKVKSHPELVNGIGSFNNKSPIMRRDSVSGSSNSSDSRRSSYGTSPHEAMVSGSESRGEGSAPSDSNNNSNRGSSMSVLPPMIGNPPASTTNHIQALKAVNGTIGAPAGPHHPNGGPGVMPPAGQCPPGASGSSRFPPQLQPKPPGPLLSNHPPSVPAEAGPITALLHRNKDKLNDFIMALLEELLRDLSTLGNPEARVMGLQMEMEKLKWRHNQELSEMKHNTDLIVMEMRASMESERQRAVAETIRQCEVDKQRAIDETKKKQWCTNCGKEALFYCCWNTSYCDYPCQQRHWPQHMGTCAQNNPGGEGTGGGEGQRNSPKMSANASHHKSGSSQQQPWLDSVPLFNPATSSASTLGQGSKTEISSPSLMEDDYDSNNNSFDGSQRDGSTEVDRKDSFKLGELLGTGMEIPKTYKKRKRCGQCTGCTTVGNCGQCPPCNSTRTHQVCRQRRCINLMNESLASGPSIKKIRINTQKMQQMVSNGPSGPSGGKGMAGPPPPYSSSMMPQPRGMSGPVGRMPSQYSGMVPMPRPGNVQVTGYASSQAPTSSTGCLSAPTTGASHAAYICNVPRRLPWGKFGSSSATAAATYGTPVHSATPAHGFYSPATPLFPVTSFSDK